MYLQQPVLVDPHNPRAGRDRAYNKTCSISDPPELRFAWPTPLPINRWPELRGVIKFVIRVFGVNLDEFAQTMQNVLCQHGRACLRKVIRPIIIYYICPNSSVSADVTLVHKPIAPNTKVQYIAAADTTMAEESQKDAQPLFTAPETNGNPSGSRTKMDSAPDHLYFTCAINVITRL
ncbi:hypothetical protein ACJJTC_019008 [Scirpophaga incertulas]